MIIFNTTYCKSANIAKQAASAYGYLSQNRNAILLQDDDLQTVADIKRFSKSPLIDMVRGIVDAKSLDRFAIIDASRGTGNMPNILTLEDITIDGRYLPTEPPIGFEKPWINLAPLLTKRKSPNDIVRITDIPKAAGQLVRANLVATYHDAMSQAKPWIPDTMLLFVIESYSMTVTMLLQRVYNLDVADANIVRAVFAIHFARFFPQITKKQIYPIILNRSKFFNAGDLAYIQEQLTEYLSGNWYDTSIIDYCNAMAKIGPARMSGFNASMLFRLFSSFVLDTITMNIAVDYPPYWVYQIMRVASGWKNNVISQYAKNSTNKRAMMEFIDRLSKQSLIIQQ